jgi:hypothetical protein
VTGAPRRRPYAPTMARRGNVKNRKQYEALKRKGMSKQRAAKITNAGKGAQKKGGKRGGRARKSRSK